MTDTLPPGWDWARLGDLGSEVRGQISPEPGTTYDLYSVPAFPTGQPEHVGGESIRSGKRPVEERDVLLCKINPRINRVWTVGPSHGFPQIASTEYLVLRPHEPRMADYLRYYLSSPRFRDWIKLAVEGATGSHTRAKSGPILDQSVPVPPLAEQERIVAALEEHFSRLDAAERALASAQQKADALLNSVVDEVCRSSWDAVPLAEIITSLRNGVFVSRPASEPPGRPIYRISAVRPLRLRVDDVRYADPEPDAADDYAVASGDLLFTRYSGNPNYVGAAAVVPEAGSGVLHPDKLIRVVADKTRVLPEWIAAYVSAGEGRRQVDQRLKTTAGQVGISGRQLKSVPIAVPSLDYQRAAVARIEAVKADQDRIERQLAMSRAKSSALRRSILSQAFTGRLVPQGSGGGAVSVMLDRIGAGAW